MVTSKNRFAAETLHRLGNGKTTADFAGRPVEGGRRTAVIQGVEERVLWDLRKAPTGCMRHTSTRECTDVLAQMEEADLRRGLADTSQAPEIDRWQLHAT
jgi:hypothetical protein